MKPTLPGCLTFISALLLSSVTAALADPAGTAFSYRGSLTVGGSPAYGTYDLKFTLFDALTNGTPVAAPITDLALLINNDLFNVALDFGPTAFNGDRRWLEIGVRTNGSLADFETLVPRQELAPQPYALYAPSAGTAAVAQSLAAGAFSGLFSLTNPGNAFVGNGAGLAGINAATLNGLGSASFWQTRGNAGTTSGLNFIGTTDNQPLELWVNNFRALRLEPNANGAPNVIGGSWSNSVASAAMGATISGGGSLTESNSVASDFGTIGGGSGNSIRRWRKQHTTRDPGPILTHSLQHDRRWMLQYDLGVRLCNCGRYPQFNWWGALARLFRPLDRGRDR